MGRFSRYAAAATAWFCLVSSVAAQGQVIQRLSVEDELGGAIVGAKVTLIHKTSGETHEASTDSAGRVAFESLSTGDYVLKVAAPGFLLLQRNVTVGTDPRPLKLKLQIEVTAEVSVTGDLRPARRTAADQNADTIDLSNGMLLGVPMQMDTLQLSNFITDFLSPLGGAVDPMIIVDGLEVSGAAVPIAAVRQVVINKNPYSPEYRHLGKARVEIVTEDGSRRHFNANAGLTFANSNLAARNAFALDKPDSLKDLTEFGFGGPLSRKNGQFLVSGERLNNQQNSVVNALTLAGPFNKSVPTYLDSTVAFGRADLKLTSADRLSINYNYVQQLRRNLDVGGLLMPDLAIDRRDTEHQLRFLLNSKLSAASTNELRVLIQSDRINEGGPAKSFSVFVEGAFQNGSNQSFLTRESPTLEIQNATAYFRGAHAIRFGGHLQLSQIDITNAANFGGTFLFPDLAQFSAGQPSLFSVNQGNPTVGFSHKESDLFFQDEVKLRPDVTLMAGARYDLPPVIHDRNNVSPRVAIAFAPSGQKTVFRAGAGMFYVKFSDRIQEQSLINDGVRTREIVISNPSYPDPFSTGEALAAPPSLVRLGPSLTTPYVVQTSVSVERELRPRTLFTIEYSHLNGYDLFRSSNPNAPQPGTGVRPDPNVLNINQVESSGTMEGNGLTFTFKSRIGRVLRSSAMYTLSRSTNNTKNPFSLPADSINLAAEMGRADYDVRHKFNMASVVTLPRDFQFGAVLVLASGTPFNITTGFDDNGDGRAADRPLGVTRNTGEAPGVSRLDLRLTKLFLLPRPAWSGKDVPSRLEINLDAFNVLNHTNLASPVGVLSSPLFGRSNSAKDPRTIQLSVKYRL